MSSSEDMKQIIEELDRVIENMKVSNPDEFRRIEELIAKGEPWENVMNEIIHISHTHQEVTA